MPACMAAPAIRWSGPGCSQVSAACGLAVYWLSPHASLSALRLKLSWASGCDGPAAVRAACLFGLIWFLQAFHELSILVHLPQNGCK